MYKTIKPGLVVEACDFLYLFNNNEGIYLNEDDKILILEIPGKEVTYKVLYEGKIYFVWQDDLAQLLEDTAFYNDSR